jgi:hypothetical protein
MTTPHALEAQLDAFAEILANDPGPLSPDSAYYVHHLHGSDSEDVVQALVRTLKRTRGSALYYFSGQRGTGKSTELKRLTVLMNGERNCRAFMVDALDYISESHPIELIDLLLVSVTAFADCLKAETGEDFLREGVGQRFGKWLRTEVEISSFSVLGVKTDFKKQQQSLIQRIRGFDLARQDRFIEECREFMRDLSGFVRGRFGVEKVVLIVDSLERLRGIGAAASEMFDRVVKVFDGGVDALRLPELQVVYSVPPYLPYLANVKQRVSVSMLASVRVCQPPTLARREPRPEGLAAKREVVAKRFAEWGDLLDGSALDRLVLSSGGDVRQLLRRLVLDVVDQSYYALDRLPLQADDAIVSTVLEKHRVEFEQMVVQEEYPLLKAIAQGNTLDLPKRSDLPVAARFFDIRAVLNYRNGVDWVDLNPLLWKLIDRWTLPAAMPPSAGASAHGPSDAA